MATGEKLYQKLVKTEEGKLVPGGWDSVGKRQRTHRAYVRGGEVYVTLSEGGAMESDKYARDEACGKRLASGGGFGSSRGAPRPPGRSQQGGGGPPNPFGFAKQFGAKARLAAQGHLFGADGKMPFFDRKR